MFYNKYKESPMNTISTTDILNTKVLISGQTDKKRSVIRLSKFISLELLEQIGSRSKTHTALYSNILKVLVRKANESLDTIEDLDSVSLKISCGVI